MSNKVTAEEVEAIREYMQANQHLDRPTRGIRTLLTYIDQQAAEIERLKSSIATEKAEAISSAADAACNQWNLAQRTTGWTAMTPLFQEIWKNLKGISEDYHKEAARLANQTQQEDPTE